eukprot:g5263.t1
MQSTSTFFSKFCLRPITTSRRRLSTVSLPSSAVCLNDDSLSSRDLANAFTSGCNGVFIKFGNTKDSRNTAFSSLAKKLRDALDQADMSRDDITVMATVALDSTTSKASSAVSTAVEQACRSIDCAAAGQNERAPFDIFIVDVVDRIASCGASNCSDLQRKELTGIFQSLEDEIEARRIASFGLSAKRFHVGKREKPLSQKDESLAIPDISVDSVLSAASDAAKTSSSHLSSICLPASLFHKRHFENGVIDFLSSSGLSTITEHAIVAACKEGWPIDLDQPVLKHPISEDIEQYDTNRNGIVNDDSEFLENALAEVAEDELKPPSIQELEAAASEVKQGLDIAMQVERRFVAEKILSDDSHATEEDRHIAFQNLHGRGLAWGHILANHVDLLASSSQWRGLLDKEIKPSVSSGLDVLRKEDEKNDDDEMGGWIKAYTAATDATFNATTKLLWLLDDDYSRQYRDATGKAIKESKIDSTLQDNLCRLTLAEVALTIATSAGVQCTLVTDQNGIGAVKSLQGFEKKPDLKEARDILSNFTTPDRKKRIELSTSMTK